MFSANEKKLIEQAESCLSGDMADSSAILTVQLRLRNLIEKYREIAKRERFQETMSVNSSVLSNKKIEQLNDLMKQISSTVIAKQD